jgi:cellulose synthase/poly-beta-1,6-N-acetylglucosamine synthase-like glycosyltransferase
MEAFLWSLRAGERYSLGVTCLLVLFYTFIQAWDYPLLLPWLLLRRHLLRGRPQGSGAPPTAPSLLVVIPSLLRKRDELESMTSTIRSIANNGYPGPLTIVVSIDGTDDAPPLYRELLGWAARERPGDRTRLWITGTPQRRSKPMAIDHAMGFVKELVARGELPEFPPVYVSTDADADLGPNALDVIVRRLQRPHWLTGAPARVVAGALHVRGNCFWQGWRRFFTIGGQLNLQVAREYYVGNVWRHNIRLMPVTGVPGAFYCTWSEIYLAIPEYLGYLQSLRTSHWLRWWIGVDPPRFSDSRAAPLPELVAGDTDDTVTAYTATIARWRDGRFTFDPPRTPGHAFWTMLRTLFVDRPIAFEPSAKVYTSSPTTIRSLMKQRRRWNCSRIELTGRFFRAIAYHWGLGLPVMMVKVLLARSVIVGVLVYVVVPFFALDAPIAAAIVVGYLAQVFVQTVLTFCALLANEELQHWRIALAIPLAPFYQFLINWVPQAFGSISDVFLLGNFTGFTPEWTLKKGGSTRIALLFRLRRALLLAVRSIIVGDVPLGAFWLGWRETPWTPSGYEGWTTGRKPAPIVPPTAKWFRAREGAADGSGERVVAA